MSDASLLAFAIRNPGRLLLGPTTVSGSWPYGGTAIGVRRAAKMQLLTREQEIQDPANGNLLGVVPRANERVRLAYLLEPPWDSNVIPKAFAGGSGSNFDGTVVPRARIAPLSSPLAFVADDPTGFSWYAKIVIPRLVLDPVEASLQGPATISLVFDVIAAIDTGDAGYPYTPTKPFFQVRPWSEITI